MEANSQRDKRAYAFTRTHVAFGLAVLLCAAFCALSVAPYSRYVRLGGTASTTIRAPSDVRDPVATQQAQDQAAADVEPIYASDDARTRELDKRIAQTLLDLDRLRADADSVRRQLINASARESSLRFYETGSLTADEWEIVLEGQGVSQLMSPFGSLFDENEIYHLLALSDTQYTMWLRELTVHLNSALRNGIPENELDDIQRRFAADMKSVTPITVLSTLDGFATTFLQPTMFIDDAATERAIALAQRNAAPVYVAEGEIIVKAGEPIDPETFALLNEAGYGLSRATIAMRWLACFACYGLIGIPLFAFARRGSGTLGYTPRSAAILTFMVGIDLALSYFLMPFSPYLNFSFLGVALISQLCAPQAAVIASILLAPAIGLMSGGRANFDYFLIAQGVLSTLFGCLAGVGVSGRATKRSRLILGGLAYGVTASTICALFASLAPTDSFAFLKTLLYVFGSGVLAGIVCVGVMPLWELAFDVTTPARLLELSDVNHPLLRRLMLETPGTYNHSVIVGSMAESCANAIGADPMLARVGAYFHDIGKLKRPVFFSENQRGENPHDAIDANTSAAIIIAHVRDGLELARQSKLPPAVRAIIAEHHGDTLVASFYAKALQESPDGVVRIEGFRYSGPRPQTREAAIVMICDSTEAAVRSLQNPTPAQVNDMIGKVLSQKFVDGQFRDCPLRFGEVERIRAVIAQMFEGMHHERVVYPDLETLRMEQKE